MIKKTTFIKLIGIIDEDYFMAINIYKNQDIYDNDSCVIIRKCLYHKEFREINSNYKEISTSEFNEAAMSVINDITKSYF